MKQRFYLKNGVPHKKNNSGRKRKHSFYNLKVGEAQLLGNYTRQKMQHMASATSHFCKRHEGDIKFELTKTRQNNLQLKRIK